MHPKKNLKYASGKSGHPIKFKNFKINSDKDLPFKERPRYINTKKLFSIECVKIIISLFATNFEGSSNLVEWVELKVNKRENW